MGQGRWPEFVAHILPTNWDAIRAALKGSSYQHALPPDLMGPPDHGLAGPPDDGDFEVRPVGPPDDGDSGVGPEATVRVPHGLSMPQNVIRSCAG